VNNLTVLNWPNRLTLLRILLIAPFVVFLLNLQNPDWPWARWATLGVCLAMGISDSLDGILARKLNQESPLGKFLDPLADKLLITCAMILLGYSGTCVPGRQLPNWVVVTAIGKDLFVLLGFLVIFFATGKIFIKPGTIGKACTVSQIVLIVFVLVSPDLSGPLPGFSRHGPKGLWFICTALAVATAIDYWRTGVTFAAGEGPAADGQAGESNHRKDSLDR